MMARINVPTNIIDSAMLKAAMDIQQQKADSISSQYKNYLSSIKDLTGTFKDLGSAYDEYRGEKTREEQASDFMEKYKDDPMAKAAAYNFISGKDPNAIQKFIDDKTKREEMEANKQKTINSLKGQIETNLRRVEAAESRDEAKKFLYAAQDVADTLANQYGIQVDIPDTLDGNQYAWQQKEAEEKEEEEFEKDFNERWEEAGKIGAAREKEYQEELKQKKEAVEYEIKEFDKQVEAARKTKDKKTKMNKLYELAEDRKILMNLSKKYNTIIPTIINADEYTAPKKPVATENTRTQDTSDYVLPKGYHWTKTTSGWYKIERDE